MKVAPKVEVNVCRSKNFTEIKAKKRKRKKRKRSSSEVERKERSEAS